MPNLPAIQKYLRANRLDGWLFYYFQANDPIAERVLALHGRFFTRRWFYFIPARGRPGKLLHRIEPEALSHLPGRDILYLSWRELEAGLSKLLKGCSKIAMQYSPKNAVPYISRVDAGTVELVRAAGARVASSGDLVQTVEAALSPAQWRQHQRTARHLREIVFEAFAFIRQKTSRRETVTERAVQEMILREYEKRGLSSNSPPIVAANEHSANPHYVPTEKTGLRPLRRGDWVLLDIWAKPPGPRSVYADITWCGFMGGRAPEAYEKVFRVVREARDSALRHVQKAVASGVWPQGAQVDRAARRHIEKNGFGKYFIHRTGHSIGSEDHGNGANIDGLETRDTRRIMDRALFSIEPGIYLPGRFGARSEINVFIQGRAARVSGEPIQADIVPILI